MCELFLEHYNYDQSLKTQYSTLIFLFVSFLNIRSVRHVTLLMLLLSRY